MAFRGKKPKNEGYPTKLVTLGDHIRKRRLDLRLIQRDVAHKIGADESSVWNWENGTSEPALRLLPAIFAFLGYVPANDPETAAAKLVAFRQVRGWSQKQLADALSVDPKTLSRWETGKKEPWGDYQRRIAALFDCRVT